MMEIKNDKELEKVLDRIWVLIFTELNTRKANELELLSSECEKYEQKHWPEPNHLDRLMFNKACLN